MSTQRTLSERDETYVGDIVRDENWLVNSSCTLSTPPNTITLHSEHKEVLRITADGRLVTGEGLSADEATQEAAKLLITSFEEQIQKMVEKRIAAAKAECNRLYESSPTALDALTAELARLRAELKELSQAYELNRVSIDELDADRARAERAETELAAAKKRIADCEFLLAHRYEIIQRQEPRCNEAIARAERAEAEVERLKGMRTAAEAIMTDVAEANEELAIARAEKAEAEAQLWHNRFASILWSGALNKHTGEDFQKWEAEFKAEQNALIARAEKAEMLLKQSPHWDTVAIIQNRDNWLWRLVRRLGCVAGLCGGVCRDGAWRCTTCGKTLKYHDN